MPRRIFITGGTGYIGSRLIPRLIERRHQIVALTRESSRQKLASRCEIVVGDALDGSTYRNTLNGADTFVHLVGVSHPSPAKAREFVEIDGKSAMESLSVAKAAGISHFIYLSVAHPAPVMQSYIDVRTKCEDAIAATEMSATILRPWYVLGPGHRWPYALIPFYKLAELFPATRDSAVRLGLVTVQQMVAALVHAIENPPHGQQIWQPKDIREIVNLPVLTH